MPTPEEALAAAQAEYPNRASSVARTHPDEDDEWWVSDADGSTFAVATYQSNAFTFRNYTP